MEGREEKGRGQPPKYFGLELQAIYNTELSHIRPTRSPMHTIVILHRLH